MIVSVKELDSGFLVNGNKIVSVNLADKYYQDVLRWIAVGGKVAPKDSPEVLLAKAKEQKLKNIDRDFLLAEELPVEYLSVSYIGGFESALSIDSYVRLSKIGGATTFNIWDVDGTEHVHDEPSVMNLIGLIGAQASANKFTKKNRKVAVRNATTISEVNAI